MKMMMTRMLCLAFFTLHSSLFTSTVMAQGMVTDIKIVAVQKFDSLATHTSGYSGGGNAELDFRKGRGGGYVFALFKRSADANDTLNYITDVYVGQRNEYGMQFKSGDKTYVPVRFFQAQKRYDKDYRGGLNGRDYEIYGGKYTEQPHVYVSHTGCTDFSNRVLKNAYVTTSKPDGKSSDEYSGGHAGGKRYFVYEWHKHLNRYKSKDINWHTHYCDKDGCKLSRDEHHKFDQIYGFDKWIQFDASDSLCDTRHYKKCNECGKVITQEHQFSTYSADWKEHNKRCMTCDYVLRANHENFGKEQIPVDDYYHMIYCNCGFLKKLPHIYGEERRERFADCERTVMEYTCKQCYHRALIDLPGKGHLFNKYGICQRSGCLHPYERPAAELRTGGDSTFVVKTFGNLYWVADYVNNGHPKTHFRLAEDLIAEDFMTLPWRPIGVSDSLAFEGTFDGGGHVITMLQTEEPQAGNNYRGLFGAVAKNAEVKNVTLAALNIRGWDFIGAVAGVNEGTISGCNVVFSILTSIGSGKNLGGICGLNKGTISGCTTASNVWVGGVRDYAGGICGTNEGGTLSGNKTEAICGSGSDAVLPEAASTAVKMDN